MKIRFKPPRANQEVVTEETQKGREDDNRNKHKRRRTEAILNTERKAMLTGQARRAEGQGRKTPVTPQTSRGKPEKSRENFSAPRSSPWTYTFHTPSLHGGVPVPSAAKAGAATKTQQRPSGDDFLFRLRQPASGLSAFPLRPIRYLESRGRDKRELMGGAALIIPPLLVNDWLCACEFPPPPRFLVCACARGHASL